MPATPDPPAWQVFPDAGGHFQWEVAGANAGSRCESSCVTLALQPEGQPSSQLPSMADLFLKVSQELRNGGAGGCVGGTPMFRTASGRSVSVRQSSIRKAESVLEETGTAEKGTPMIQNSDVCDEGFPMFLSGSGKPTTVRPYSTRTTVAVIEGAPMVQNSDVCDERHPMFCTGSGKSVTVRQSSIRKAAVVLEGKNLDMETLKPSESGYHNNTVPLFQTGSGKSILLKQSSIMKAASVLKNVGNFETGLGNRINNGSSFSNSLFQTGSGKTVNISSAGLLRAATLLGVEENHASSNRFASEMIGFNYGERKSENADPEVWVDADLGAAGNTNCGPKGPEMRKTSDSAQPTIKFHTAGGRYISVSTDALQRAKSLLDDVGVLPGDTEANKPLNTFLKDAKAFDDISWNKENLTFASLLPNAEICKTNRRMSCSVQPFSSLKSGGVTFDRVNACGHVTEMLETKSFDGPPMRKLASISSRRSSTSDDSFGTITTSRTKGQPLVEISNNTVAEHTSRNHLTSERKRLGRISSISPFKRPRNSRFTTPLKCNSSAFASGPPVLSQSKDGSCRKGVSTCYPVQFKRKTIKEFFGRPPFHTNLIGHLPDEVKHISADTAQKYRFHDACTLGEIGPGEFLAMLLQSGASSSHVTNEWVSNHYKWIVWKLASLERCYPAQASSKFLTVPNVLEELKYRYEREVKYGHRSAIKKILDGDASAASAAVLCISAILSCSDSHNWKMNEIAEPHDIQKLGSSDGPECHHAAKIELSDGWYAMDAQLDISLSKQLIDRKLFVGQKLRIVGAHLCGWVAPVSPLEAHRTVSLLMTINGTYRAHWADPLGFCKGIGVPLAFSCIKSAGGKVPKTLVGVTRIYPVLYKERLPDGGSIVRSERMEKEVLRLYDQRRFSIVEDVVSKHQDFMVNGDDSEEGAKIFKLLQTAAEPEVLMADMTSEQLSTFTEYQAKHEANRQSEMHKKIEKALEDAGLGAREVTPFMRVRVVGLTSKGSSKKARPKEGLVTIWSPTEKQKQDLVEGQLYCVQGLMPLHSSCDVIYLQGRGSSTLWEPLPPKEYENFESFFTPRKPVSLANLGDVPLASEFDIAAVVVHVGELSLCGRQKKQWVFMTDGSCGSSDSQFEDPYSCLLAVDFCGPNFNNDSSSLISHNLSGTVVGFFNLVKRARDQMNHLWVAETSENSSYSVYNGLSTASHLNKTGESAQKWAKISCSTIQKLRERVLCIIQGHS